MLRRAVERSEKIGGMPDLELSPMRCADCAEGVTGEESCLPQQASLVHSQRKRLREVDASSLKKVKRQLFTSEDLTKKRRKVENLCLEYLEEGSQAEPASSSTDVQQTQTGDLVEEDGDIQLQDMERVDLFMNWRPDLDSSIEFESDGDADEEDEVVIPTLQALFQRAAEKRALEIPPLEKLSL